MLLLNSSFYKILSQEESDKAFTFYISINPEHAIFEGHFPGQPVVPGVCMMQIVAELASKASDAPKKIKKAGQVKFLQLLQPVEETYAVVLKLNEDTAFSAEIKSDTATIMKMSGHWA